MGGFSCLPPHHLHINRTAMFRGGRRPDLLGPPLVKHERQQKSGPIR